MVVRELLQMRPGDLSCQDRVIGRHVGLMITRAVLRLHGQPATKLLQVHL